MARYFAVSCDLPASSDERLCCLLEEFPVLGAALEEGANGQRATIYVAEQDENVIDGLGRALTEIGALRVSSACVESRDWLAAYRRQATPFLVGDRWWIDPDSTGPGGAPDGRIRLAIEPSAAFGSGSHESTQLVLLAMQDVPVAGRTVLDVGTGSGILAVAANALGAGAVYALDCDAGTVWTARRVVRQQGRGGRPLLVVATTSAIGDSRFDVVLCNMMSSEFIPLLSDLARVTALEGRLVISGALFAEREVVLEEFERVGMRWHREQRLGEWVGWTLGHD